MKRLHLIVAALLLPIIIFSCGRSAATTPERELVNRLLAAIDSADYYYGLKEAELERQKQQLAALDESSREWIILCESIASNYVNFIADSCIAYCNKAISRAQALNEPYLYRDALLTKVRILNRTGYFVESSLILGTIKPSDFREDELWRYYSHYSDYYHSLYISIPRTSEYRSKFTACYNSYRDTLLSLLSPDNEIYLREREKIDAREGRIEDALKWNDMRLERRKNEDPKNLAGILYDRHAIYRYYMKRPTSDHVEYLLESAILDVVNANQNIASLRHVEDYLISEGDVSSAKTISDFYYSALLRYGSRTRLLDALDIGMRINNEYSRMLTRQKRVIQASLVGIIVLLAFILLILKQVLSSRHHIRALNQKLEQSSKTALSYVLGFFNLYSSYLTRLLSLRSKINVNVRRGNYDYVLSLTDPSNDITGEELKSMHSYFDKAFLDIFPNFVDEFNALLKPECRITPKPTELLNQDLRIFAIIKLGISDSQKISELLHCSIKMVYNKRSEMNSKLAVDKDDFMKKLMEI
ncbi:MAG: hypothetical protein J6W09_11470 [Bacteroidales bacterium]|nr:hypothetical protein [Bacteroidales bacterium]